MKLFVVPADWLKPLRHQKCIYFVKEGLPIIEFCVGNFYIDCVNNRQKFRCTHEHLELKALHVNLQKSIARQISSEASVQAAHRYCKFGDFLHSEERFLSLS